MLYNLLIAVIALSIPFFCYFSFNLGFEIGQKVKSGQPRQRKRKIKAKKTNVSDETRRLNTLLENIEAYDGSAIGQKEI